ncbi:MAG: hypothetical protein IJQ88_07280, partial [Clostridia bacterium]|nr:hypothetical protein [Clostridia bacterium]
MVKTTTSKFSRFPSLASVLKTALSNSVKILQINSPIVFLLENIILFFPCLCSVSPSKQYHSMSGTVPDRFVSENASIRKQQCQESPAGGMMSVFADSQRSGHHLPDTFLDGFPLNYPASFLAECQAVCLNRSIAFPQKLLNIFFFCNLFCAFPGITQQFSRLSGN